MRILKDILSKFKKEEAGLNVLSLFDGISCGQVALERAGIKVNNYFASEIDKNAIKVTMANYPNTIQIGDVRNIDVKTLPKIDLLIGGSPCQNLSIAGNGKGLEGEKSCLFYEYARILKEIKPKYFLLENVKMKKENEEIITNIMGVKPIIINSSLVSAQNRVRLYWTNIPNIEQPKDLKILLNDIIEDGFWSDRDKAYCIDASYYKGGNLKSYFEKRRRQIVFDRPLQIGENDLKGYDSIKRVYSVLAKSPTLTTCGGGA